MAEGERIREASGRSSDGGRARERGRESELPTRRQRQQQASSLPCKCVRVSVSASPEWELFAEESRCVAAATLQLLQRSVILLFLSLSLCLSLTLCTVTQSRFDKRGSNRRRVNERERERDKARVQCFSSCCPSVSEAARHSTRDSRRVVVVVVAVRESKHSLVPIFPCFPSHELPFPSIIIISVCDSLARRPPPFPSALDSGCAPACLSVCVYSETRWSLETLARTGA